MKINIKEKLKIYTIKEPKELLDGALGNNAEPIKEYPDWDEASDGSDEIRDARYDWDMMADRDRKHHAERWDR